MKKNKLFFSIITIIIVGSCKQRKDNTLNIDNILDSLKAYSKPILREPRKLYRDSLIAFNDYSFKRGNWEVRISLCNSKKDSMDVVLLKKEDNAYSAFIYTLIDRLNESGTLVDSISKLKVDLGIPISGWQKFEEKLFTMDFIALRSQEYIHDYPALVDIAWNEIEAVVDSAYYHAYLAAPQYLVEEIPEARFFVSGISMIKNEFKALDNKSFLYNN